MTFPYAENIYNAFDVLTNEVQDLYLRTDVPVINKHISALEFQRDWVATNLPVLIKGAVEDWPAIDKWTLQFFRETFEQKKVTIAVTPNGYADAVATHYTNCNFKLGRKEYFTLPEERVMTMAEFIDILEKKVKCPGIFYLQQQNSNLTKCFPELLEDISPDISWATEALNGKPEAVNLWIGDCRAITSMHKDPYENIYCVISGHKDFILHPPTDRPWIPYKKYPVGIYKETMPGKFEILPHQNQMSDLLRENDIESSVPTAVETEIVEKNIMSMKESVEDVVPWICVDPLNPDFQSYPLYRKVTPVRVRVQAGDALYLPSLWFHHVQQSHGCIAVNYWYDMRYDIRYAYFQMLEHLAST